MITCLEFLPESDSKSCGDGPESLWGSLSLSFVAVLPCREAKPLEARSYTEFLLRKLPVSSFRVDAAAIVTDTDSFVSDEV